MEYNITYRQKDKGWQYIISCKQNGKWKQLKSKQGFKKRSDAKPEAENMLKQLKEEIADQEDLNQEYQGITFEKFLEMYIAHEKLYREENTIEVKQYTFKKFQSLNKLRIEDIKNIDIQKCVDVMVKDKLSLKTIKDYLSMLKALFNSAIDEYNILKNNPVRKIKLPEAKQKSEKRALTQSEFENLLSKIKDYKLYVITLIAGSCGLRIGEILGLLRTDFDADNMILTVRQQQKKIGTEHKSKNTKTKSKPKYGLGSLKSKNSYREVPISDKVCKALKRYESEYPKNIDGRIFNFTNTASLASRLSYLYATLGYNISVHELRHTYATLLISENVDLKTVAKLMGHSVEQTIKTYSHVTDDMMEKATQAIHNIF